MTLAMGKRANHGRLEQPNRIIRWKAQSSFPHLRLSIRDLLPRRSHV